MTKLQFTRDGSSGVDPETNEIKQYKKYEVGDFDETQPGMPDEIAKLTASGMAIPPEQYSAALQQQKDALDAEIKAVTDAQAQQKKAAKEKPEKAEKEKPEPQPMGRGSH